MIHKKISLLLVLLTLGVAVLAWAQTDSESRFRRLAETDVFPEVRQAAANVLADIWASIDISLAALNDIAADGLTAELRGAAQQAIAQRTVSEALSTDDLIALVEGGEYDAVRALAADQLADTLAASESDLGALIALANHENETVRQATIRALTSVWLASDATTSELVELAIEGTTSALRQAAANAAVARLNPELEGQSTSFLLELAQGGALELAQLVGQNSAALKQAAAEALRSGFESQQTSIFDVEAVAADTNNSPALRQVAGEVLAQRLLRERRTLEELLALAGEGPTPEVQAAAVDSLEQALVTQVGLGNLPLQDLVDQIVPGDSDALNTARANAVYTLLRPNLIFVTDQPLLEAVLRKETVTIGGAVINGENDFLRAAGTDFLAGLFLQFGAVNRFEDPLSELTAMASDTTLEPEFRIAAGQGLEKFLQAQRGRALDAIAEIERVLNRVVISGRRGQTEDAFALLEEVRQLLESRQDLLAVTSEAVGDLGVPLRFTTIRDQMAEFPDAIRNADSRALRDINSIISGQLTQISVSIAGAPDTLDEDLIELATNGLTPEVRQAAANALKLRLSEQAANGEISLNSLLALAAVGQTPELQSATVDALTLVYAQSELTNDELFAAALEGETSAVQRAAALAWAQRQNFDDGFFTELANGSGVLLGAAPVAFESDELASALTDLIEASLLSDAVSTEDLLSQAQDNTIPALKQAASRLLPNRFLDDALSREELIDLAVNAQSDVVRQAASEALATLLISQQLPEFNLFGLISQFTLAVDNAFSSQALAEALVEALEERFRNPLEPTPAPGKPLTIGQGGNG